jgi:hypothetical protein
MVASFYLAGASPLLGAFMTPAVVVDGEVKSRVWGKSLTRRRSKAGSGINLFIAVQDIELHGCPQLQYRLS